MKKNPNYLIMKLKFINLRIVSETLYLVVRFFIIQM